MDLLAHKVSKVTQEKLESPDNLVRWVPAAPRDPLENLEMMVKLEKLVNLETVDLLDLRGLEDSPELQVCPESRDTEVIQVSTVPRESPELSVLRERLVLLERVELLDLWAPEVCLEREVVLDPVESLVLVEMMACPVPLVLQVL